MGHKFGPKGPYLGRPSAGWAEICQFYGGLHMKNKPVRIYKGVSEHLSLDGVCVFWTDEFGQDHITPEGAAYLATPIEEDAEIQRKRSSPVAKRRKPGSHDWRHFAARSKGKKMGQR